MWRYRRATVLVSSLADSGRRVAGAPAPESANALDATLDVVAHDARNMVALSAMAIRGGFHGACNEPLDAT